MSLYNLKSVLLWSPSWFNNSGTLFVYSPVVFTVLHKPSKNTQKSDPTNAKDLFADGLTLKQLSEPGTDVKRRKTARQKGQLSKQL